MRHLLGLVAFLFASIIFIIALDWRSPLLVGFRPQMLAALIVLPLLLIIFQVRRLRRIGPGERGLKALHALGLLMTVAALCSLLVMEARFHWARRQVLNADPGRLEELGRHVIVGFRDLEEVRELIRLKGIAGVFFSGHNVEGKSADEIRSIIASFQSIRSEQELPPLWIASDQEGGVVSRLSPPLERMPALSEIVAGNPDPIRMQQAVWKYAESQARELAGIGVNLNFAPVVDLNHNVVNPADIFTRIHLRAISDDPVVTTQVAGWYCAALEAQGVRCTLKHFPGLGRVVDDTHLSHADLKAPVAELVETDWVPFRELMSRTGAFTMLGHARLTAMDPQFPVSISHRVVAGLLRGEWNYDGVLITDDFSMYGVYRSAGGMEDGSIRALNAGVDLILISWDPDQYYRVMSALLEADRKGLPDREALRRSNQRLARTLPALGRP